MLSDSGLQVGGYGCELRPAAMKIFTQVVTNNYEKQ